MVEKANYGRYAAYTPHTRISLQKTDLRKVTSESKNLSEEECEMIHNVLSKYELLFDRTLDTWKTKTVDLELYPYAKP